MNILEKNSYKIDNDVLTIRSICGEYSFKMEESGTTDNIHRIAQMMVSEMIRAEESFINAGAAINPHVLVLLANLNLSKKYVELKDRLDTLNQTLKEKTQSLSHAKIRTSLAQASPPQSPKPDEIPEIEDVKPKVINNPLESDIIDDLQQINSLLSDPVARTSQAPFQNPIPGPSDLSQAAPIKDIEQPAESAEVKKTPEPDKTSEIKKISGPENTPESNNTPAPEKLTVADKTPDAENPSKPELQITAAPEAATGPVNSDPLTSPSLCAQVSRNPQTPEAIYESTPTLQAESKPEVPSISGEEKLAHGSQSASNSRETTDTPLEQPNSNKPTQVRDLHASPLDAPPLQETAEIINEEIPASEAKEMAEAETQEAAETEKTSPLPESKTTEPETSQTAPEPKTIEPERSQAAPEPPTEIKETAESEKAIPTPEAKPAESETLQATAAPANTKCPKEETPCNENPASMGSFPIHTAVHYSQTKFHRPDPEKDSMTETFELPSLKFLKNINSKTEVDHESIRRDAELLEKKLGYFGIKGEVMGVSPGPVITTFEYKPDPGIKISKIVNLADDLALALSAYSIRIVAPIPGKDVMGIEIPNLKKSIVPFIDIVSSEDFINSTSKLPICLGKDIIGNPVVVELESMPHLLIAGATGTGKSVGLNAMITSILYKANPDEVKFLMIDPKRIELSLYNDIPHLITPVITDMKKATTALQWMVREMERRYDLLAKYQVRNIEQFNQKMKKMNADPEGSHEELPEPLSYIVIIIDELADLMMTASRDVELSLTRLAQMARAAGIHLILATQRPSVDVLTGIIKANFPTRISFQVSSKTDSRTIIDSNGAETLLGMGDMLFVPPGTARLTRVHGTYLSEEELIDVTSFLKAQQAPEYLFDIITEQQEEPEQDYRDDEYDEKYHEALEVVMATRQASISGIQRALRVGYNRAARIIDIMEKKGIVGPSDGAKPRQVLSGPMD